MLFQGWRTLELKSYVLSKISFVTNSLTNDNS